MWSNIFSRLNLIRFGIAIISVIAIVITLPRTDHQSFSYELNQPWKYPLLTADFDMPILRDSVSARAMRDSIDKVFIPFVKRNDDIKKENIDKFTQLLSHNANPQQTQSLLKLMNKVYDNGLLDSRVYAGLEARNDKRLRLVVNENDKKTVVSIDASDMLSPAKAYAMIDSIYHSHSNAEGHLNSDIQKAINLCLNANIVIDSLTDYKYRSQEYLNVTGAMGIIKKGQRIVDRGEIINRQIFTNLNTYQEMMVSRQSETNHTYFIIGQAMYIILIISILYIFLSLYRSRFFGNIRKMSFLMSFTTLFILFAILMCEYFTNGIYLIPFAAVPVIILVFFDSRTAIFSLLTTVLISALVATYQFQFIFMEFVVGLAATFSLRQLSRRSQLLRTAVLSFISYVATYFTICLITEGNLSQFSLKMIGTFAINSVILSFAYILILVIEKIFGLTSTVTLVELSDINNKLLQRLATEAPGTFQHSIQVSTLASEAARAIGANSTMVRTGALYHDIGKMTSPIFFTENQHGVTPHAGLDPETSAHKIISHVTEGVNLASKAKLPEVIKEFIREHHGRGLAKYFYTTAVNENPDKVIDKSKFQYPGPNPQSKETAILMMADAVEAASRSLKDYTPASIDNLVDRIIDSQIQDGLLKEAPISMRDIETVKRTFKTRLSTIYHSRVAYPEMKKNTATAEELKKNSTLASPLADKQIEENSDSSDSSENNN